jgi:NADP-dependent 3-hydroxy acid dehydrogenase YdfG
MTSLQGKVAFVTGASSGIGAAVSRALVEAGASVGMASRRGDDLGLDRALGVFCDVRDAAALESAVAATVERFGRLDILVANAGVGAYGPFLELSPEFLDEMIDVNLKGTIYAVRAALPHLLESDAADIVTVASEAGRRGLPYEAVYCASKFGRSASRGRSTTSCGSRACGARTCARAASRPSSRSKRAAAGHPTCSPG